MKCDKKDLLLYAVTDRSWLRGRTLREQVREALEGGATFVQLREKIWTRRSSLQRQRRFKSSARPIMCLLSSMTM